MTEPREVLIFDEPGMHTFQRSDYPWLVSVRVHLKTAGAGTADGPGENGYAIIELYDEAVSE